MFPLQQTSTRATGQRIVSLAGKHQEASSTAVPTSQGTRTTRTSPHTDPNSSPIQSNEIFDEAMFKNNSSSISHAQFVEEAINELCKSGRVIETSEPPLVVNPLSVSVQANGKRRLILDLRHVNKYLTKKRVKYEDWKIAMSYFTAGAFMFSFDLKSGYHHIEIFKEHQVYLGFSWTNAISCQTKFYMFTVLPFGLSSAPHIFTKTLKPLEKHWRHQGICIAIFLDDGWAIENDHQVCATIAKAVKSDLAKKKKKNWFGWFLQGFVLKGPFK